MLYFICIFLVVFGLVSPAAAEGKFLPLGGEDAYGTHVQQTFTRVMQQHELIDIGRTAALTICARGDDLACGYIAFLDKVDKLKGYEGLALLRKTDALFNRLPYRLDSELYGEEEYWASPAEFMAQGAGDCEDYALAKYVALKSLGWPEDTMHVVVLWNERDRIHHAVLLVEHEGEEWMLDDANRVLRRSDAAWHYVPLYAINGTASAYFHGTQEVASRLQ